MATPGVPAVILIIVLGLVQTLFGYRLFRILIALMGALLGFLYAPEITMWLTGQAPGAGVTIAIGVGLAVVFSLLAWSVFWLAVFVWGASVGYVLGLTALGGVPWLAFILALGLGAVAVVFQRVLIVLLTAINGAWLVVSGAAFLAGSLEAPPRGIALVPHLDPRDAVSITLLVLTLALAAVGAVFQFRDASPMFGEGR